MMLNSNLIKRKKMNTFFMSYFFFIFLFVGIESSGDSALEDAKNYFVNNPKVTFKETGNKYYGEVSKADTSVPHGHGTMQDASGRNIYDGMYSRGKRHGKGKLFYRNNATYEGQFQEGEAKGFGTFTDPDGVITEGYFENGQFLGYVRVRYPSGRIREGYKSSSSWRGMVDFLEHKDGPKWNEEWKGNSFLPDMKISKLSTGGAIEVKCEVHHGHGRSFDISIIDNGHPLDVVKEEREEFTVGVTKLSSRDTSDVMCVATDYSTTPETVLKKQMNTFLRRNSCGISPLTESNLFTGSCPRLTFGCKLNHGDVPWQALIYSDVINPDTNTKFGGHCGGVIIEDWLILTAAHCVKPASLNRIFSPNELIVKVGYMDRNNSGDYGSDHEVESIKIHPNFTEGKTLKNDIALIALKKKLSFSNLVSAVCLPKDNHHLPGKMLLLSGYGNTGLNTPLSNILRITKISYKNIRLCEKSICSKLFYFGGHFCAGGAKGVNKFADSCNGDSGGPVTTLENDQFYLVGIVSHGPLDCGTEPGAVYTTVSYYLDWIKQAKLDLIAEEFRTTSKIQMSKLDGALHEEILQQYFRNFRMVQYSSDNSPTDICHNENAQEVAFDYLFLIGSYRTVYSSEVLSLSGKTCRGVKDFPMKFGSVSTLVDDGVLLVCGGPEKRYSNQCYKYNPLRNEWEKAASMRRRRCNAKAILLPNSTWWVTGDSKYGNGHTTEMYDVTTGAFRDSVDLEFSRGKHSLVKVNDTHVMILGDESNTREVWMFHLETNEFKRLQNSRKTRQEPMAGLVTMTDGTKHVVLAGGEGEFSTELFSLEEETWSPGPVLPYFQFGACVAQTDDTFYVVGGYEKGTQILKFDLETEEWVTMSIRMQAVRSHFTCTWVKESFCT